MNIAAPRPDAAPVVVDHDEHGERAEGERLDREQIGGPDAGRVVAEKRAPRLARGAPQRLPAVATHGAGADLEAKGTQLADDADGAPPRMLSGDAQWRCGRSAVAALRESGVVRSGDDSSSASRRAKQNDATAHPCPARPSRACLASRTNHVPAVTRVGGRGDGAAVDDGPGCRRRADAAALSARGRDLGGRGPMRRVLRQADGGRAQTSLSWLADTLLSQHRTARIKFCRPTGARKLHPSSVCGVSRRFEPSVAVRMINGLISRQSSCSTTSHRQEKPLSHGRSANGTSVTPGTGRRARPWSDGILPPHGPYRASESILERGAGVRLGRV